MGRDADIVVVGAGIMGVATARALAQAGRGVVLIDQFEAGHARGSSHGASRIFRLSYPDQRYVRLAQGALQSWRELEAECGEQLIVPDRARSTSARSRSRTLAPSRPAASATSCSPARRSRRGGRSPPTPSEPALFQPDGGTTLADRAYQAMLAAAVDAGAVFLDRLRVTGIEPVRGAVRVTTEADEYTARACVVAAGAWASGLLAGAEIELPVIPTRETVAYFRHPDPLDVPPVIDDAVPGRAEERAAPARSDLLRAAGARRRDQGRAPSRRAAGRPGRARLARRRRSSAGPSAWAARRFPGLDPEPVLAETCLYTSTADEAFVLERHGRDRRRVGLLRPRLQVRAGVRANARGPRPRGRRLNARAALEQRQLDDQRRAGTRLGVDLEASRRGARPARSSPAGRDRPRGSAPGRSRGRRPRSSRARSKACASRGCSRDRAPACLTTFVSASCTIR